MEIFCFVCVVIVSMATKRSRVSRALQPSTSNPQPTPDAPTFPKYKFYSEANAEIYLKLSSYHIMRERAFNCKDLGGYDELVATLQQRQWVRFNNLIQETNKSIGLEFYENDAHHDSNSYTSYVRSKYVDFSA